MPGVGSAKAANYLYNQAPRDGLTIGVIGQQLPVNQALGDASVKFDMRQFNWLGRFTSGGEATVIWHTSPVKSLADAMKRETTLASTSAGSSADAFPLLMNRIDGNEIQDDPRLSGHHRHRAGDGARRDRRRACHARADRCSASRTGSRRRR